MTKREEYEISFQKKTNAAGNIIEIVTSNNSDNLEIAYHISVSDKLTIEKQIFSLQDASMVNEFRGTGERFWGLN